MPETSGCRLPLGLRKTFAVQTEHFVRGSAQVRALTPWALAARGTKLGNQQTHKMAAVIINKKLKKKKGAGVEANVIHDPTVRTSHREDC